MRIRDYPPAVLRATVRISLLIGWTLVCYLASVATSLGGTLGIRRAEGWRARISRLWLDRFRVLLGTRIVVRGAPPRSPYFLVANHISWIDFTAINAVCKARYVVMAETAEFPFIGRLTTGLRPIYVKRTGADKERVIGQMAEALRRGDDLAMAPEAGTSPGRRVYRFHAALLEAAVVTSTPVDWAAMTFRTPAGWPAASRCIPFPDPYFPESTARFGGEHSTHIPLRFLAHLARLTALPHHVAEITFGADPVSASDRITLANRLEAEVRAAFVPLE